MTRLESLALALLYGSPLAALWLVPGPSAWRLADPACGAIFWYLVLLVAIAGLRFRGARGARVERVLLAGFLAAMPLVYVASWALSGAGGPMIWVELGGLAIFSGLAWAGLRRSPWFLVAGIALHGIGWDLWHHGRSGYITGWYPMACLVVDVAVGLYAAARVRRWREAEA
jgi:hypothetical protein